MRIQSPKSHWTRVGIVAASMNLPIAKALTGKPAIDAWIVKGYRKLDSQRAKARKETYDLVCSKIEN